jgi:hypothetical protein
MARYLGRISVCLLFFWPVLSGCQNCCAPRQNLLGQGSLMQSRVPGAAIAPPNSYSYGQPDRYYPQNGLASNNNPPPPAMGRANAPPGRFYDPRNALVANELGPAAVSGANTELPRGTSTWERNGDFASISRTTPPNNSRLEAISGMPVNDGTRSYSPRDLNNTGVAPRSDLADRYGTRRGYATRSSTTGGSEPNNGGNYALRGMRGTDSRQFQLGERDENAERR